MSPTQDGDGPAYPHSPALAALLNERCREQPQGRSLPQWHMQWRELHELRIQPLAAGQVAMRWNISRARNAFQGIDRSITLGPIKTLDEATQSQWNVTLQRYEERPGMHELGIFIQLKSFCTRTGEVKCDENDGDDSSMSEASDKTSTSSSRSGVGEPHAYITCMFLDASTKHLKNQHHSDRHETTPHACRNRQQQQHGTSHGAERWWERNIKQEATMKIPGRCCADMARSQLRRLAPRCGLRMYTLEFNKALQYNSNFSVVVWIEIVNDVDAFLRYQQPSLAAVQQNYLAEEFDVSGVYSSSRFCSKTSDSTEKLSFIHRIMSEGMSEFSMAVDGVELSDRKTRPRVSLLDPSTIAAVMSAFRAPHAKQVAEEAVRWHTNPFVERPKKLSGATRTMHPGNAPFQSFGWRFVHEIIQTTRQCVLRAAAIPANIIAKVPPLRRLATNLDRLIWRHWLHCYTQRYRAPPAMCDLRLMALREQLCINLAATALITTDDKEPKSNASLAVIGDNEIE